MRVHELARELGLNSKDVLDRLQELGVVAKNHMTALNADAIAKARASFKKTAPPLSATPPVAPESPIPAPAAATPTPAPAPATDDRPVVSPDKKLIILKGPVVVRDLAEILGVRPNQLIAELMRLNVLASINEQIDFKDAGRIAEKHGYSVEREKKPEPPKPAQKIEKPDAKTAAEEAKKMLPRAPVVTVLGHVDHGKTSLLDKIRNTSVAKGEAGGITQHIGASTVHVGNQRITFLDTPGHEAFTAMRSRGANMTDIAIIVVDAKDGLMPQTQEAIKHAQAANVPIIVAINKIDLPAANPDRVKQQLAGINLTPEDWGGQTICKPVSALTGEGIPELLEMVLLQAEVLELKASPGLPASGFVIESQLESGMGPTANLLVTNGTLRLGDIILCGSYCGRVRALLDDHGAKLKEAGPSTPVKCLGLSGVPDAGAPFEVYANEKAARIVAEERLAKVKLNLVSSPRRASLANLFEQIKDNERVELKIVLKADVQGSLEAIDHALKQIKSDKVSIRILMTGVGSITSNDVLLASASDAIVIGFHVSVEEGALRLSKQEGIEIRLHSIIYELVDRVREAMTGLLTPILKEKMTGRAEIKQVFTISKGSVIAGCVVLNGYITPRVKVRVKRQNTIVYEGAISSLRRFQNEASEVRESQECGIRLDNFNAFVEGDILECFEIERIAQTL